MILFWIIGQIKVFKSVYEIIWVKWKILKQTIFWQITRSRVIAWQIFCKYLDIDEEDVILCFWFLTYSADFSNVMVIQHFIIVSFDKTSYKEPELYWNINKWAHKNLQTNNVAPQEKCPYVACASVGILFVTWFALHE